MGIENPVHLIFIAAVALIVLGPKRLPGLARALGQGIREFRAALSEGESHADARADQEAAAADVHEAAAANPGGDANAAADAQKAAAAHAGGDVHAAAEASAGGDGGQIPPAVAGSGSPAEGRLHPPDQGAVSE